MRSVIYGLAVSVLVAASAVAALAGAAPAPAPVWGVVDMDRVSAEYKGMQSLNAQFQDFQRQQEEQIQRRQRARLLSDEELREYLDLCTTAAPTEARDTRLTELEKLSDDRSRRLMELTQKSDRSAGEESEFQLLDERHKRRAQELDALQTDARKAVLAKYEEFTRIIQDSLNAAVRAVAEEKKLQLVLRKEVVLYGGLEITEDVIAKLNAAPAPAPAAPR